MNASVSTPARSSSITSGLAMLYGRFATSRVAPGTIAASSSAFSSCLPARASPSISVNRSMPANRSRSSPARSRSISTATTRAAGDASSSSVSVPVPGPTSTTVSPGRICPAAATVRTRFPSIMKFCPNRCRGDVSAAVSNCWICDLVWAIGSR